MEIKQPSRGAVIMMGRAARSKLFGSEEGQHIVHRGYTDNGLLPEGGAHVIGAKYLMYSERLRRSSNKQRTVQERKKEKVAKKVAAEKVLTFADAMPNCGIWIEDEHAFDPSEVDGSNLDCME